MKRTTLASLVFLTIIHFMQGCRKASTDLAQKKEPAAIAEAHQYFTQNLQSLHHFPTGNKRIDAIKEPYWEGAVCINSTKGIVVVVPLFYQQDLVVTTTFSGSQILSLNRLTKLILYKDSSTYQSQVVTFFPDTTDETPKGGGLRGKIFTESWQGQPLKKYKFAKEGIFAEQVMIQGKNNSPKGIASLSPKTTTSIVSTCTTIYGYNYSPDGEAYFWSEPGGCDYQYLADDGGGGAGLAPIDYGAVAGAPFATFSTIVIPPPTNLIANINDYTKCFSNYGGNDHTYQVTVCVDQPVPGSRQAWTTSRPGVAGSSSGSNPVDAGHVFLVLSENFSGYSIVRNVGFYPQVRVYPWSTSAQGQLNNDDGHAYNISLTATVDNGQFFNILNYISQGNNAGVMYDLNTNNCTSFAIHALGAGNVILPSTVGTWLDGGFGNDPGDLGEDIRGMTLAWNMTRSTGYNDHPNLYTCN